MRKLLALLFVAFVFVGCNQKTVQLKMPDQNKSASTKVKEDKTTVIEEFKSNDSIIQEQVIDNNKNGSMNNTVQPQIDESSVANNNVNINIDETRANIKLAFVYPSTLVSKYAKGSLSTISGYLMHQKANYNLVVIDSKNESYENINSAFSKLKEEGITKVIALFTPNALNSLNQVVTSDLKVYLPLIEKKDSLANNNLIFGSISYDDQLKKLSYYSNGKNVMFYQDTYLGNKIKKSYDLNIGNALLEKEIKNSETNFKDLVNSSRLANSSLFLDTDLVKSSLILSQMTVYEIAPSKILATQILFDPMLLNLTQSGDRDNLVIANSIENVDPKLKDDITTLGGDITYEWVNYSVLVGTNYLFYDGNSSLIPTQIENNQAIYTPRLFQATDVGFLELQQ